MTTPNTPGLLSDWPTLRTRLNSPDYPKWLARELSSADVVAVMHRIAQQADRLAEIQAAERSAVHTAKQIFAAIHYHACEGIDEAMQYCLQIHDLVAEKEVLNA